LLQRHSYRAGAETVARRAAAISPLRVAAFARQVLLRQCGCAARLTALVHASFTHRRPLSVPLRNSEAAWHFLQSRQSFSAANFPSPSFCKGYR